MTLPYALVPRARGGRCVRGALLALAVWSLAPDAFAGGLVPNASNLWVPATTLSLTLITAFRNSKK